MSNPSEDLSPHAARYANLRGIRLELPLGFGKDGTVYSTSDFTAVKVFARHEPFERERACYLRLGQHDIQDILGQNVPQMLHANEDFLVIEMTIVRAPFLLDFAGAYLDQPPDFSAEIMEYWEQSKQEEFGPNWPRVQVVLSELERRTGIYFLDVHPGNIGFLTDATPDLDSAVFLRPH